MDESFQEDLAGDARVERSVDLDLDPEHLWDHLVDGELLTEWMGAPVEIEPRVGGRIEMGPVWGTIEEIDPPNRIQWSWRTDEGMPSLVEIELEPTDGGTTFSVRETLLPWRVTGPDAHITVSLAA